MTDEVTMPDLLAELQASIDRARGVRQRGLEVDGDVLRDAIAEAAPREWTDTAALELADRALDAAVRDGITVLHGPDLVPRAATALTADITTPDGWSAARDREGVCVVGPEGRAYWFRADVAAAIGAAAARPAPGTDGSS